MHCDILSYGDISNGPSIVMAASTVANVEKWSAMPEFYYASSKNEKSSF